MVDSWCGSVNPRAMLYHFVILWLKGLGTETLTLFYCAQMLLDLSVSSIFCFFLILDSQHVELFIDLFSLRMVWGLRWTLLGKTIVSVVHFRTSVCIRPTMFRWLNLLENILFLFYFIFPFSTSPNLALFVTFP